MSVIGNIAYAKTKNNVPFGDKVFVEYLTLRITIYAIFDIIYVKFTSSLAVRQ